MILRRDRILIELSCQNGLAVCVITSLAIKYGHKFWDDFCIEPYSYGRYAGFLISPISSSKAAVIASNSLGDMLLSTGNCSDFDYHTNQPLNTTEQRFYHDTAEQVEVLIGHFSLPIES